MADTIDVKYTLSNLHCSDEGDGSGDAEPYLWTVWFKVDGDTVKVNDQLHLEGKATVVATPGNHGDLVEEVDAGQNVAVPASLGSFSTTLRPIPTPFKGVTVGGIVGCLAILLEEDSTPDDAIANGHKTLNKALQQNLDTLIPTLGAMKDKPTDADIDAIQKAIEKAVVDAIADGVDFWDVLGGLFGNNQDEIIGTARFIFAHDDLDTHAGTSFAISKHWANEGDWRLDGDVRVDKTLAAGILRSGEGGDRFLLGRTTAEFVAQTQKLFDDQGLRLVHLETWTDHAGVRRWASIHRKGSWGNRLQVGLTTAQFVQKVNEFRAQGMELERMVNWVEQGGLRWAGCWRSGLPKTHVETKVEAAAFKQLTQDLFDKQKLRITQAVHYVEDGHPRWAAIYQLGDWGVRFYIRDDLQSFRSTVQGFFDNDHLRVVDFETWVEGGTRRYAGISRSGSFANRLLTRRGLETFRSEVQKAFDDDGLRPIDIDVYQA